jgi:branched-chain amino acid transport system permease protein
MTERLPTSAGPGASGKGAKLSRWAALAVGLVLVFALPELLAYNDYWLSVIIVAAVSILTVAGVRLILLVDQISLGQVAFSLIGAYGSALLMMKAHLPFILAVPLAGIVAAVVAAILAYPFLKVKGIYFSILTLLTAETFRLVAFYWQSFTGGSFGLVGVPGLESVTLPLVGTIDFTYISNYYYVVVGVIIVCMAVLYLLERSRVSFRWQAIRDSEELARSVGINVMRYKAATFVVACFFAGIAGALYAHFQRNLSADATSRFGVWMSLYMLVYLVVGGRKSFWGPVVGTIVLTIVAQFTRSMNEYQPLVTGVIAILVMLFLPGGLLDLPRAVRDWRNKDRGEGVAAPAGSEVQAATDDPVAEV